MYERQKAKLKELFHADADFGKGEILQDLKKYKCWISGGAILSIFTGEEVNDVDVFFRSKEVSMLSTLVLVTGISQNGLPQLLTLSESLFSLFTRTHFLP